MDIRKVIENVINDEVHGMEFYEPEMIDEIEKFITHFSGAYQESSQIDIINGVNEYFKTNVNIRKNYFEALKGHINELPYSERIYRTGYAAIFRHEAICTGYAEAERMLLESMGVKTKTILAKIQSADGTTKPFFHYAVIAKITDEDKPRYMFLDPEREASCERKGKDFEEFTKTMILGDAPEEFICDKLGKNGLGASVDFKKTYRIDEIGKLFEDMEKGDKVKEQEDRDD